MADRSSRKFVIVAEFEVKPEKIDRFMELAIEDASQSIAKEPDCLQFDVTILEDNPNHVLLYEVYADEAAFDAHLETPHCKVFREQIDDLVDDRNVRRLNCIHG
ncbi:MAG: putative quinol monooxygenase [Geminicoccaceae bacterium]